MLPKAIVSVLLKRNKAVTVSANAGARHPILIVPLCRNCFFSGLSKEGAFGMGLRNPPSSPFNY